TLLVAFLVGLGLKHAAGLTDKGTEPGGVKQGVGQGALLPLALPNLALGNDVTIYAAHNTGRAYKLGYTVGVNGCGLAFFGFFFWRVSRWRKPRGRSEVAISIFWRRDEKCAWFHPLSHGVL